MSRLTAAELAAALHTIADEIATLGDRARDLHVTINIQPSGGEQVEIAAVDLIGEALYGKPGETYPCGSGHHHGAYGHIAGVSVRAFVGVTSPAERELRAELERLRAQLSQQTAVDERHETPAGCPLPAGVDGYQLTGRDGAR